MAGRGEPDVEGPRNSNPAQTTTLKFNKLVEETKQQLHRCYHSKKLYFEQFAHGLQFTADEIGLYLPIVIETNLCEDCPDTSGDDNETVEYKKKEKENCDKINVYFDELSAFINQYHQNILTTYKEQSDNQFKTSKQSPLKIELQCVQSQLGVLLTDCYQIIDGQEPDPPQIAITNGDIGGLVIEILDKDKSLGDKYQIVINDSINKEYINEDNKEQYIELIDDINPATLYHIAARRYIVNKQRWSKYCTAIDIVSDVKFAWSKRYRGSNAKLSNLSRDVYCKSHKGSSTIVADKDISSAKFKQVVFSFTMKSLGHLSYCGFVQYTSTKHLGTDNAFEQSMRPYWDDLVVKHTDAYCLGFCNESTTMQRWVNGSKKGRSKWGKDLKLQNGYKIHTGDVLLFHVNFDRMVCDVYVNEKSEQNKISADVDNKDKHTFKNVPEHIIPVYSH
eukprot:389614_1